MKKEEKEQVTSEEEKILLTFFNLILETSQLNEGDDANRRMWKEKQGIIDPYKIAFPHLNVGGESAQRGRRWLIEEGEERRQEISDL